jgi:subtilisin family serine protease
LLLRGRDIVCLAPSVLVLLPFLLGCAASPREEPVERYLVEVAPAPDLAALGRLAATDLPKRERRARVVAALAAAAARREERLRPFLERARRDGRVRSWRGYTVVNRLLVEATPAGIEALVRHPEVLAIVPETEGPGDALARAAPVPAEAPEKTSWGLAAIGAETAWAQGLDGSGVVVGAIDSGASARHEQLAANFRGGTVSWLDPTGRSAAPVDTRFGHGTGVLSCAAGRNVVGVSLGVAPGARWIACAGLPAGRYNNVLALDCADWMLTSGQPDVLIVAWSLPASGCDRSLQPVVEAWRAAEILPVFAAGNHGPAAGSARSPANYQGLSPFGRAALSIGGLARDRSALAETARGPGACGGAVFPLLIAPAEELVAAFPITPSSYVRARGTSYAAGLAAGAAALLLQRHPEASVVELEEALVGSAADLGPAGPDGVFGYGALDVPAALARLDVIRTRGRSAAVTPP